MTTPRCQICNSPDTKYKCTICRAPSCSLPCFQQHKLACAEQQVEQPVTAPMTTNQSPDETSNGESKPPLLEPADLKNLFQKYPNLRGQLRKIYQSTRNPSDVPRDVDHRDMSGRSWKPEKGFQIGLSALRRLAEDDSANSEGVAAFMKLLADKSTV